MLLAKRCRSAAACPPAAACCLLQPCRHTILPTCLTGPPHAQDKVLELYERHMSAPNREERQRKDVISHFVLRLAYCRTGVCWRRAAGGRCRCCIASRDHGLHCRWLPTHRHQLSSSPCMSRCRGPTPLADRPGVRPVPRPLQGDGALRPGGWAAHAHQTAVTVSHRHCIRCMIHQPGTPAQSWLHHPAPHPNHCSVHSWKPMSCPSGRSGTAVARGHVGCDGCCLLLSSLVGGAAVWNQVHVGTHGTFLTRFS